ncbi:MAG: hypothetical protein ABWZ78_11630 [Burkholderiaceae bacterium]
MTGDGAAHARRCRRGVVVAYCASLRVAPDRDATATPSRVFKATLSRAFKTGA